MPSELDIRALVESKMRAELVAIAEDEGATYSERGTKRDIAVEILEAREAVEADEAKTVTVALSPDPGAPTWEVPEGTAEEPFVALPDRSEPEVTAKPEAEIETAEIPAPVEEAAPEAVEVSPEVAKAIDAFESAAAAFLIAGAVDGPERKARREAKAKLYALLA